MEKFRWCFIGTGKLANEIARLINASGRHEIVSVYTRRPEVGRAFCEKYGGVSYATAEEAISAPGVEAVYVVTPHTSHYRYTKMALEAGKPVLNEKAFTIEAAKTDELIALARQKGLYLCEGMWTWFGDAANQAKKWIDEGQIGQANYARLTYHMNSISYAPRVSDPALGGGALLDITIYPITYLYRIFGYPTDICCKGKLEGGIDLGEDVTLTFANGLTATVSASIVDFRGLEKMTIRGDKGEIRQLLYHFNHRIRLHRFHRKGETFKGETGYVREFDTVASEIREGLTESRMVPLKATSDVMHILDECRRQMGLTYNIVE